MCHPFTVQSFWNLKIDQLHDSYFSYSLEEIDEAFIFKWGND